MTTVFLLRGGVQFTHLPVVMQTGATAGEFCEYAQFSAAVESNHSKNYLLDILKFSLCLKLKAGFSINFHDSIANGRVNTKERTIIDATPIFIGEK